MKKQINPTIKAHLLRGAFFLLLLVAVCAIPFALAQRNQRSVSRQTSNLARLSLDQKQTPKKQQRAVASDSFKSANPSRAVRRGKPRAAAPIKTAPSGIDCDNEPGIVIHDDGSVDNGYSGGQGVVTTVIFADKFTPAIYPSIYTAVCLDFITFPGGPTSYPIEVVVFDDDGAGGSPGTELGSLPVTASVHEVASVPTTPIWNSFDISSLAIVVNDGSVYIGARYAVPQTGDNVFTSSDENGPGFGNGYWFNDLDNVWAPIQNAFPLYRAMFIRAVEQLGGLVVTSTDPANGSIVFTQPTDFVVNVSEPVDSSTLAASDFTVNGIAADTVDYTAGEITMTFHYTTSPVTAQGEQTMHIDEGAFLSDPDGDPVHEFNGTFRYDATLLAATDTDPPVGGTFTPPAPGTYTYDVNWNEPVDPASVETGDLQVSGNSGPNVTNVEVINGNMTTRFTLSFAFGGNFTADIAAGAITDAFGNPNDAFSGSYTVEGCPPGQYVITPGTDAIVPGDTDIGNHTDDGSTFVSLPFTFQLYDQSYNGVYVDSNGRLDFVCNAAHDLDWVSMCLPATDANVCPYTYTVFPLWTDQCTDNTPGSCGGDNCTGCGIFTSVQGTPGDQIFTIEWRTVLFASGGTTPVVNYEVRLYENPNQHQRFDVIYGDIDSAGATQMWVAGVQKDEVSGLFSQDFCLASTETPPTNVSRTYDLPPCASPTPSPTIPPSPTPTPTVTPTPTPSGTPSPTPSPTPRVTPRPRPTPHPRPTP